MSNSKIINTRRIALSLMLITILMSIYMLSYSARIQSGDTLRLFDSASSLVRYGDLGRDETTWFIPPSTYSYNTPYVFTDPGFNEVFAIHIISFYYQVVDFFSDIGLIHGVWTFNILITSLAIVCIFWIILILGYSDKTAFIVSVLLGVGTIILPYSKTLFREPLTMLLICHSVLWLLVLRNTKQWLKRLLALFIILTSFYMAWQIKESTLLIIPALIFLILPQNHFRKFFNAFYLFIILGCIVAITIFAFIPNTLVSVVRILPQQMQSFIDTTEYLQQAIHTYIFSIGGSIWGTSPIILLSILGTFILLRQKKHLYFLAFVSVFIFSYSVGHALLTGIHWFGGLSWPSRFMVPAIPLIGLLIAPFIESILSKELKPFIKLSGLGLITILMVYSLWIQYIAVSLPWFHYSDLLPEEANRLIEWSQGLNSLEYLRWVLLPPSIANLGYDIAWLRAGIGYWLIPFTGITFLGLILSIFILRSNKRSISISLLNLICLVIAMNVSLKSLFLNDTQYLYDNVDVRYAFDAAISQSRDGEPLILVDQLHSQYAMNTVKSNNLRVFTLPPQPANIDPDSFDGVNTILGMEQNTPRFIDYNRQRFEQIRFITNKSSFQSNAPRIVERYLTENYYPIHIESTNNPDIRLITYHTAPTPTLFTLPDISTDIRFGNTLRLRGIYLPEGDSYTIDDSIPFSLMWENLETSSRNYVVATFLSPIERNTPPIQGLDSFPMMGFQQTSNWNKGQINWDNRGLLIPDTVLSGDYEIWVIVYHTDTGELQQLEVHNDQIDIIDSTIAVLPITIHIE